MTWRPTRSTCAASLLVACLALTLSGAAPSDSLYMPRTIKQAIRNGTRTLDGKPGPRFWQNHARYDITLTVLPPDPMIRGQEQITYINNSPDSLPSLVFKLFLNVHKPGAVRNGVVDTTGFTDGVQIDQFTVGGAPASWRANARTGTWQAVRLPHALAPHDSVRLGVDWHVQLSTTHGREGIIAPSTWYLAYFYPRVAVYDDYNGWDQMDFTGSQEFYSDFNDYHVAIHAPRNFVVWGTGMLADASDVLQPGPLARYTASLTSDDVIHVATADQMAADAITRQDSALTWTFDATNVPDVAFGVSNRYDWDAASVIVDSASGRRASVQSAFNDSAADFHHMVGFARQSLAWFSSNLPGVPYPYPKTTVFQGYADMEYPMMVNDNTTPDTTFDHFVVAHELAHTWFPFYMGIDETRYGFMDEGWATTFEYLINRANMGPAQATTLYKQFRITRWIHDPSPLGDLPIITPEDVLKGAAYGDNAYGKASLGYLAVRDLLGDATFRTALHAFIDRWHGKHPTPWDFFYTFNDVTGRDLNWFWQRWFFDNSYIDLGIATVDTSGRAPAVTVDNIGGMPAPFDLVVTRSDGSTSTIHETPAVWQADPAQAHVTLPGGTSIRSVTIDGGIWMDADLSNNRWPQP